jgi:hypothetical protein
MEVEVPQCTKDAIRFFDAIKKRLEFLDLVVAGGPLKPI